MQRTTTPFQEVVALFWHDHFAASNAALETNAHLVDQAARQPVARRRARGT